MKRMVLMIMVVLAFRQSTSAQIVNIETKRLRTDSVRFAGDFNLALLLNSTNGKDIATIRGNLILQTKSKNLRHIWLMASNYDFAKAEQESFVNAFYLHFRYNYKINHWLRWEAFVQTQTNEPLGIQFRQLLGTGPRFKLELSKNADFYLGTAYMYEYEKAIGPEFTIQQDSRWSNYISLNIHIPKVNGSLISTLYFQPLFNDLSDHRIMNDTKIDFSITERWHLYTRFSYYFDAAPPPNIRKSALNFEQGFGFKFK